jgi:tetratricopeptide (TPR) repeat protein
MGARIFVSYRRKQEGGWAAESIATRLRAEFGREQVFLDVKGIAPGAVFRDVLRHELAGASALVVMVGADWHKVQNDDSGTRRLDDEDDWVREEIRTAIKRGIHIFPLLLDAAGMPKAEWLPADIQPFAQRQAWTVRQAHVDRDLDRFAAELAVRTGIPRRGAAIPADSANLVGTEYQPQPASTLPLLPRPGDVPPGPAPRIGRAVTPYFTGRNTTLAHLDNAFATAPGLAVQCLTGLGGVGKSELAAQYAHNHADRYPVGSWWIIADSAPAISAGLAALARQIIPACAAHPDQAAADWAIEWLRHWPGWLLVLDDVTDPGDVTALLAGLHGTHPGHLLLTTRRDIDWTDLGLTATPLQPLDDDDATAVLLHGTADGDAASARAIATELGGLPLALAQAAATVRHRRISLARYQSQLREHPQRLYAAVVPPRTEQDAVARVWGLTLDTLAGTEIDAVRLLSVLSWLAPDDVPRDLVTLLIGNELTADELLALLTSYSMATVSPDTVSVHRLVQAVVRDTFADPDHVNDPVIAARTALILLSRACPRDVVRDLDGRRHWLRLIPHALALVDRLLPDAPMDDHFDAHVSLLLNEVGVTLIAEGRPADAVDLLLRSTVITERVEGPDHPFMAVRLNNLATAYLAVGRLAEAEQAQHRALDISIAGSGPNGPDVGRRLSALGAIQLELDRPHDALASHLQALAVAESQSLPDDFLLGQVLQNLAAAQASLGQHEQARTSAWRAIQHVLRDATGQDLLSNPPGTGSVTELAARTRGIAHAYLDVALAHLACAYRDLGRHPEALELRRAALDAAQARSAPRSDLMTRRRELGNAYHRVGRHAEARDPLEQALALAEDSAGTEPLELSTTLSALAMVRAAQSDYSAALQLMERAVGIAEAQPEPPDLLVHLLEQFAAVHERQGDQAESVRQRRRALDLAVTLHGERSAQVAQCVRRLAHAYHEFKMPVMAERQLRRALRIAQVSPGKDDPLVADCLEDLAEIRWSQSDRIRARQCWDRALKIREATPDTDAEALGRLLWQIGLGHGNFGDQEGALEFLSRSCELTERAVGEAHQDLAVRLACLAGSHHALGHRDDAVATARRALTITESVTSSEPAVLHAMVVEPMQWLLQQR